MVGLMGKPRPMELRTRVVAYVDEGHGHREAARHFRVSPKFVNDLVKRKRRLRPIDFLIAALRPAAWLLCYELTGESRTRSL